MCVYIYIYIYTYIHTHIHTYTHTYIQPSPHMKFKSHSTHASPLLMFSNPQNQKISASSVHASPLMSFSNPTNQKLPGSLQGASRYIHKKLATHSENIKNAWAEKFSGKE